VTVKVITLVNTEYFPEKHGRTNHRRSWRIELLIGVLRLGSPSLSMASSGISEIGNPYDLKGYGRDRPRAWW
jgi:hypothetical protein